MAIDELRSHVIQPCSTDRAVFCFDFDGCPKFKYMPDNGCFNPRGVALDGECNIYACEDGESSIHVISPTGLGVRIVKLEDFRSYPYSLYENDERLQSPVSVAFETNGERFAITSSRRNDGSLYVIVFKLEIIIRQMFEMLRFKQRV